MAVLLEDIADDTGVVHELVFVDALWGNPAVHDHGIEVVGELLCIFVFAE